MDKKALARVVLLSVLAAFLTACGSSNSGSQDDNQEIVSPVQFPIVIDNELYEFNPNEGRLTFLLDLDTPSIEHGIFLDVISGSTDLADDTARFLPEYYVYTVGQDVFLYELPTKQAHTLYSFPLTTSICGIKPLKIFDQNKINQDSEYEIKDSDSILVEISNTSCEPNSDRQYFNLAIEESFTETYDVDIEDIITPELSDLLDGDDCGETEANVDLPGSRSFTIEIVEGSGRQQLDGSNVSCDELLEEKESDEHPITQNRPVLLAKATEIDDALYNYQEVVVDKNNGQFGYLGYSTISQQLKFYLADKEDGLLNNTPLWEQPLALFSWNGESILPNITLTNHHYSQLDSEFAIVENGWNIHKLSYESIFDDDFIAERIASIGTPLFSRTPFTPTTPFLFDISNQSISQNGDISFFDSGDIYFLPNSSDDSDPDFVRSIDISSINQLELTTYNTLLLLKSGTEGKALTSLDHDSTVETTIIPATGNLSFRSYFGSVASINMLREDNGVDINSSQLYDQQLSPYFNDFIDDTIITPVFDQSAEEQQFVLAKTVSRSDNEVITLLFHVDRTQISNELNGVDSDSDGRLGEQVGEGEFIGMLMTDSEVSAIDSIWIISNNYGLITIATSDNSDERFTYYFDPSSPYNPDLSPQALVEIID